MRWQDMGAVLAVERASYPQTAWSEATWWAELAARPRRIYLVCTQDAAGEAGELLGYAGLDVGGEEADVMTITVDPARRGGGIGTTLLLGLHEHAIARGVRRIVLEVRADNERAQHLYARHGYEAISRRRGYYQPEGVDAIVLRAHLAHQGDHETGA